MTDRLESPQKSNHFYRELQSNEEAGRSLDSRHCRACCSALSDQYSQIRIFYSVAKTRAWFDYKAVKFEGVIFLIGTKFWNFLYSHLRKGARKCNLKLLGHPDLIIITVLTVGICQIKVFQLASTWQWREQPKLELIILWYSVEVSYFLWVLLSQKHVRYDSLETRRASFGSGECALYFPYPAFSSRVEHICWHSIFVIAATSTK